jgi:hypothetical protein
MSAYTIQLVATDYRTGKEVARDGRIMQVTAANSPPDFVSAAEMIHDELIDTEELAEQYCQHQY